MKKELTQEEKDLMPVFAEKWKGIYNNGKLDYQKAVDGINWLYGFCGMETPKVYVMDNPLYCQVLANQLIGNEKMEYIEPCGYLGYSNGGWVSFYDFFTEIGVLDNKDFNEYKKLCESGIYYGITLEGACIVSAPPTAINCDTSEPLHNVNGAAVEFPGYNVYAVNGRNVDARLIEEEFTVDDLIAEENEDIKAAMVTIIKERYGAKGLLDFLGAKIVDEQDIEHFEGYTETVRLYKTTRTFEFLEDRNGNKNVPYCWSEMVCPSTGSTYLIDNSADFTDAVEAVKWLRPAFVPQELSYQWEKFAN